ncbi:TPA: hypothetical protein DCX16_06625 [bacterium]|nr:hypothetical protein [bacterium]
MKSYLLRFRKIKIIKKKGIRLHLLPLLFYGVKFFNLTIIIYTLNKTFVKKNFFTIKLMKVDEKDM